MSGSLACLMLTLAALLWQADEPGTVVRLTQTGARNRTGAWSLAGDQIAFVSNRTGSWQLWVMSPSGDGSRRLTSLNEPVGRPSWSPDGSTILFESGFRLFQLEVASGEIRTLPTPDVDSFRPLLSPDGEKLLFDISDGGNHDLWVQDRETGTLQQLTSDPGYDSDARWAPDGNAIVFHSDRGAERYRLQVFIAEADGSHPRRLTTGPRKNAYPAFSPSGRCIVYTSERDGNRDLWLMDRWGDSNRQLTTYEGFDGDPVWKPTGGAILFSTARFGGEELALLDLSESDSRWCEEVSQADERNARIASIIDSTLVSLSRTLPLGSPRRTSSSSRRCQSW